MAMNELLATIFDYSLNGSIVLLIIGGCSVVSFAVFIERMLHLRRAEIDTNSFIIGIRKYIKEGNIADAIQYCQDTGGTIGNIVKSGVARHNRQKDQIEHAMELSGLVEISHLEKNAKVLSIIAHIAPLIGLLGTVLGFIQAFAEMRASGLVDISATRIGDAMEYALVSTAAGLVVAIPSVIAYNYIVSRVEGFVLEIQTTSAEIVDLLLESKNQPLTY